MSAERVVADSGLLVRRERDRFVVHDPVRGESAGQDSASSRIRGGGEGKTYRVWSGSWARLDGNWEGSWAFLTRVREVRFENASGNALSPVDSMCSDESFVREAKG